MIHVQDFVDAARMRGFDWYAGVPCSFLTPFINYVISDDALNYVSAANEGDAVALAAGAAIGGKRSVAMMQNSGLGNAISPLTSLTYTFRIPILVICTHRGAPGVSDEPQHELMGTITESMFDTVSVPWSRFPSEPSTVDTALDQADKHMRQTSRPYAMIMGKGTCEPFPLAARPSPQPLAPAHIGGGGLRHDAGLRASRHAVLSALVEHVDPRDTVLIATTGFTGRELYAVADRANHLYMVGSMGCASSLGLGLALARPDLKIVVIDGDGAALMRMGNVATIGAYRPANLFHLLLDNEAHDSTGAQATVSACTDFAAIAAACGYRQAMQSDNLGDLTTLLDPSGGGPRFLHLKIRPGTIADLPRPAITPVHVLERLKRHIGSEQ